MRHDRSLHTKGHIVGCLRLCWPFASATRVHEALRGPSPGLLCPVSFSVLSTRRELHCLPFLGPLDKPLRLSSPSISGPSYPLLLRLSWERLLGRRWRSDGPPSRGALHMYACEPRQLGRSTWPAPGSGCLTSRRAPPPSIPRTDCLVR
ncbi:hypothetical protein LX36DRAFT_356147 [Colletotrichum falcatum]|nr:hypothetical protein LX36DRAFT_356147 [Colletotrichum falcatum]